MSYDDQRKWETRADRHAEALYRRPVTTTAKWGCLGTVLVLVLVVIIGIGGLFGGWFNGAKETVGFDNTKAQTTAVIGDEKEMIAIAGNVCDAKAAGGAGENDPQLVETPEFAYRAQYRRVKADYDRRMDNLFEAKVAVRLTGSQLPRAAPTLSQRLQEVC